MQGNVTNLSAIFSLPEWPFKGVLSFWSYMMNTKQLPYFTNIVCQAGYHFSLVIPRHWFLLDFSLVVSLRFVPLRCSVLSISLNSVHNSDAFTFMLLKNRHWKFHWRNISSFKEHLLRKLTLMAEPKCNGTSRTRYIFLVTDFSLPNLRLLNGQSTDRKINAKHGRY